MNGTIRADAGPVIDSHTVLYGVIGDPIRHSKSPVMLNRAFRETGVNAVYAAFHVAPDRLAAFAEGARAMGMGGFNVTIPHKTAIMAFLDEIDPTAEAAGAVNTVVRRDDRLIGFNTDGPGYVRSLKEEAGAEIAGRRIVVLGAGGAARGILHALAREKPARIAIVNRTVSRAEELARSLAADVPRAALGPDDLREACADADIVINTTSAGMLPNTDELPLGIDAAWMKPGAVASDIVYNPMRTRFLMEAERAGCRTHGGLGMFIYQGAYAFEYWTGRAAPVEAMRETVIRALGR
jgi:shikimate dehydrogenase